ncbi:glycosyltransferase family 4 protein [Gluconacetobacter tumulisoli]|uniref:Glycosyltransferase family 4 protein n=2 Tax=Gluconacetobacter tumulisoli TaxID=1286189 RepID=A0A7W4PK40_9PROT|nr:glycosyltransferase family 4 protein [Gluconacetobacter tumulisoli]
MNDAGQPIRAFVQLSYGYGATTWHARWQEGRILGLNEEYAYGYLRASEPGFTVTQSEDAPEGVPGRLVRYSVRLLLGFDFIHAWRNRAAIFASDVVWTHTESQSLAVQLLLRLFPRRRHPRTIAQSVWLIDRWSTESRKNRFVFRNLLSRADILTFLSPCNMAQAASLFPDQRVVLMEFGIRIDEMIARPPHSPAPGTPVRVLSLGNDRHRDWTTLLQATSDLPCQVTVATTDRAARRTLATAAHVTLATLSNNTELFDLYDQADLVVVPVGPNQHASGITAIQEATARGVPVIATDVGGLRHYFGDDAIRYVPVGDAPALARAITELAADPAAQATMVAHAQQRMRDSLNSRAYVARHVALSRDLLSSARVRAASSPSPVPHRHPTVYPQAGTV